MIDYSLYSMKQSDTLSVVEVFQAIQSYYQNKSHADASIRNSFANISDNFKLFKEAEDEYKRKAQEHQLHELTPKTHYGFQDKAMLRFYRLLDSIKLSNNKTIYEHLAKKGEDLLCPYCNLDNTSELDHFLPKSVFYDYAVTPINLIPICVTCNSIQYKGEKCPHAEQGGPVDYILHPYFDDFLYQDWLCAELSLICDNSTKMSEDMTKLAFKLKTQKPSGIDDAMFQRFCAHYEILQLKQRITPRLNEYLHNKKQTFKSYISRGMEFFKKVICCRYEENKNNPIINVERLFYTALYSDPKSTLFLGKWCR